MTNLITDYLQEVIYIPDDTFSVYWGTAPTGKPHIGYLIPLLKIKDLVNCNNNVTILYADIHASLDNLKSTPDQVQQRLLYYDNTIKTVLKYIGVDINNIRFVTGSSFQKTPE